MSTPPVNSCNSSAGLIEKYINSAYDNVKAVADNLDYLDQIYQFLLQHGLITNIAVKAPVQAVAASPITLSGNQVLTWSVHSGDYSVLATTGMRVLVLGQTNPVENGIYDVQNNAWTRSVDFDGPKDVVDGTLVFSSQGDVWQVDGPQYSLVPGTDPIIFKDINLLAYEALREATEKAQEAAASAAAAAASENAAKTSEMNSKDSELAAEAARDQIQQIINDAGEQSTLVALAQPDGFKNIGRCSDIATLRTITPSFNGQQILLERAVSGGPRLTNVVATYQASSTEADNGFSIFTTPTSGRWVIDTSETINVWLAGFDPAQNNLAQCINKIAAWFVSKAISKTQINDKRAVIVVPVFNDENATSFANYTLTDTLKVPPSLASVHFRGNQLIDCTNQTKPGLTLTHEFTGLNKRLGNSKAGGTSNAGGVAITSDGVVTFRGTLTVSRNPTTYAMEVVGTATNVGMVFGNLNTGFLEVRGAVVENVKFVGFYGGLQWGHCDTYLNAIKNSSFAGNVYNQYQPTATTSNSGEGLRTDRVTFSDSALDNIYIDVMGHDYVYDKTHIDYAGRHGINFGTNGASTVDLTGSPWMEGNDGFAIARPQMGNAGQSRVTMLFGKIVPNRYQVTYRGVRPIFSCPQYNKLVVEATAIDFSSGYAGYMCNDAFGSLAEPGDNTFVIMHYKNSDMYKWLPNWRYGAGGYLLNALYQFSGASGDSLPTTKDTANAASAYFWALSSAGATTKYADAVTIKGKSYIPIAITLTNTNDTVYLYNATEIKFPRQTTSLSVKASVKCADAVGNVNIRAIVRSLGFPNISVSGSVVTQTENTLSGVQGDVVDVKNTILTQSYITATKDDFVSTPPLLVNNYFKGSISANAGFLITGFTGTIYLLLPALWFNDLHPNV